MRADAPVAKDHRPVYIQIAETLRARIVSGLYEDKIDGEYCQIHVDLAKTSGHIQIFSKSGKDSTEDKEALHSIIRSSLDMGKPNCRFSKSCILEGEVVVYSDHVSYFPFSNPFLPLHYQGKEDSAFP